MSQIEEKIAALHETLSRNEDYLHDQYHEMQHNPTLTRTLIISLTVGFVSGFIYGKSKKTQQVIRKLPGLIIKANTTSKYLDLIKLFIF